MINKLKIEEIIEPSSSMILKIISFAYLLTKKINISFPIYAPPCICKIHAGKNVKIGKNCFLKGKIHLGNNVSIGENSFLDGNINISKETNLVRNDEIIGDVK